MANNLYDDIVETLGDDQAPTAKPAAPANPYDAIVKSIQGRSETELRATQIQAQATPPDRAADALALSKKLGVPYDLVTRDYDEIKKRQAILETPYFKMLGESPALVDWLKESTAHAAIAKDDLEPLGFLEWLTSGVLNKAARRGTAQVAFSQLSAERLYRALTADEEAKLARLKADMNEGGALGVGESWWRGAIVGSVQNLPNQITALVTGFQWGTKGAITAGLGGALLGPEAIPPAFAAGLGAGMMTGGFTSTFQLEAGAAYDEYLGFKDEAGRTIDPRAAKMAALATGAINGGLEMIGLGFFLKSIPGARNLTGMFTRSAIKQALRNPTIRGALVEAAKSYGETLLAESSVEAAQKATEILSGEIGKIASGADTKLATSQGRASIAQDIAGEFTGAVQSFALGLLPGPAMAFLMDARRAQSAGANREFFTALSEGVAQSKTFQRSPDAAMRFLERASAGSPVETLYAPVEAFTTYWQSQGVDPRAMATELTGDGDAFDQALRTGEDLQIPTARYAVKLAATPHNAFFANELRLAPDAMNAREAEAFAAELTKANETAAGTTATVDPVRAHVVDQLIAAGVEPGTADHYAALYEAAFQTIGQRAGIDPKTLYRAYGLNIERPDLDEAAGKGSEAPGGQAAAKAPAEGQTSTLPPAVPGADTGRPAGVAGEQAAGGDSAADATGEGAPAMTAPTPVRASSPADIEAATQEALGHLAPERATLSSRGGQASSEGANNQTQTAGQSGNGPGGATTRTGQQPGSRFAERVAPNRPGAIARRSANPRAERGAARRLPAEWRPRFALLIADAREHGYTGSDDSLAALFLDEIAEARSIVAELNSITADVENSHLDLLKIISGAGGIGIERESGGGYSGELETLLEGLNKRTKSTAVHKRGKRAGTEIKLPPTQSGGLKGLPSIVVRKGGMSLDQMREHVQQSPAFASKFEDLGEFFGALRDAVLIELGVMTPPKAGAFELESTLTDFLQVKPGTGWWINFNAKPAADAASIRSFTTAPPPKSTAPETDRRGWAMARAHEETQRNPQADYFDTLNKYLARVKLPPADRASAPFLDLLKDDPTLAQAELEGETALGPVTFNVTEFDQGLFDQLDDDDPNVPVDTLSTGEKQPRLPGAESVRDQEVQQPAIADVPFSLTAPPVKGEKRKAGELPPSEEYLAARAESDRAGAAFAEAQRQYRAREIGDDAYLAARAADDRAREAFDAAYMREQARGRSTRTLFQDGRALTADDVVAWAADVQRRTGPDLKFFDVHLTDTGDLALDTIAVQRGAQRAGLGSATMRALTQYADAHGKRIVLTPAGDVATARRAQLVKWYQGFGFVENVGRHHDETAAGTMYRTPSVQAGTRGLGQDGPIGRRGAIRFAEDRQMTISLFPKADLSTFLHETGHFYLEVFSDVIDAMGRIDEAARTDSQRQLLADWRTLLDWWGIENTDQIEEKQHEEFARAFEGYLMGGEAPSVELRSSFARFRAWLVGIYRAIVNLNIELTPEVRGVMDRMLATDRAIFEVEQEGRIEPMFLTAEAAGYSPEDFALYRDAIVETSRTARETLERRLMADVAREQSAEWKRQRAEVEATVTEEVHDRPVYRALAAIQKGTTPAGAPLLDGLEPTPLKLSKDALVAEFGADRLKRLPRPYVYTREGGMSPAIVADMFGFATTADLLQALEEAGPIDDVIQHETDRRMIAEHGSILLDGTLQDIARAAVANDYRERVVREELRALANLRRLARPFIERGKEELADAMKERQYERRWIEAEGKLALAVQKKEAQATIDALRSDVRILRSRARGGAATIRAAIPSDAALRQHASERIAGTRVRAIKPAVFWSASRKAAQRAIDAAARQDFESAIVAKQEELINLALYRAAVEALDDVATRVNNAKALATKAARSRIGLAGETYLDQVDSVLDRFSFATVSQKALDRRSALERWIAALKADGMTANLPDELLDESRRVPYQELTYEELVGVTDGLDQILHLARLKNRLLKSADKRTLDERAGALSESIRENAKRRRPANIETHLPQGAARRLAGRFHAWQLKLGTIARMLDGDQDGGPAFDAFVLPMNDATDDQTGRQLTAAEAFQTAVDVFDAKARSTMFVPMPIAAIGGSLTRAGRIMVALNWGNDGNRQRLMSGYGWNESQVAAVLDALDRADWEFVKAVWKHIDSYKEAIAAKEQRVYGIKPTMVEATPFETKYGPVDGGYFPIRYDPESDVKAYGQRVKELAEAMMAGAFTNATTRRGFTKERAAYVRGRKLQLDFSVIWGHVNDVIHDLTHHEALIDVNRMLRHPDVVAAIRDHYGMPAYREMQAALEAIAAGDIPVEHQGERVIEWLRVGTSFARMGWNLLTTALQPLGLSVSWKHIGGRWVGRGIASWLGDAVRMENSLKRIHELSPFMRDRSSTFMREVREVQTSIAPRGSWALSSIGRKLGGSAGAVAGQKASEFYAAVEDTYFWFISRGQLVADIPTWLGAEAKALAAGESQERAVKLADQAVIDTQGSGHIKDLAHAQRGTPVMKMFTQFMSYFSVVYQQASVSVSRTRIKDPASVLRLGADLLILYTVPMVIEQYMRNAITGDGADDKDPIKAMVRHQLAYAVNSVVFLREFSGVIEGFPYTGPAGAGFFSEASKLYDQAAQGKADAALIRAVNQTAGVLFHYPATEVERLVRAAIALEKHGAGEAGAALFGRKPDKKK